MGEREQKVFDDLKSRMSRAPILGLLNFDEMFMVETDASDVGIGVVLLQKGQPLCYFSRKLVSRMRIAATYQKVADALSRMFKQEDNVMAAFMTLSQPLPGLIMDQFTKHAHFEPLPASFNASKVADVFIDMVVKHHGIPKTIISNRDPIFVSKFWKQLFKASGTKLSHSTAYHPLDRRIGMTPYQAVYGHVPPFIIPYLLGSSKVTAVEEALVERDALLRQLKQNMLVVKHRMEIQANWKWQDVEFNVGDMVLVKLQPYRRVTLAKHHSNKLAKRYYGTFKVLELVGKERARNRLQTCWKIHLRGNPWSNHWQFVIPESFCRKACQFDKCWCNEAEDHLKRQRGNGCQSSRLLIHLTALRT
ncbi:ty3-gypsy retrotransposon protein, partial [Tanacetum coccineum]